LSKISLEGNSLGTGTFTIASPNSNSNRTLNLPDASGTMVVTGGAQTIEFAAGTVSAPSITTTGDTNTGIYFPAADTIAFTEGGTESMRIDSSGNVGIGTSSPASKLDVSGGSAQSVMTLSTTGASPGALIRLLGATSNYKNWAIGSTAVAVNGALEFVPSTTNGGTTFTTPAMIIDSSGNVGIGTTSPDERLDVSGTGDIKLQIQTTSTGSGANVGLSLNASTEGSWTIQTGNAVSDGLRFYDVQAGSERARITSGGNFLVGTTTGDWTTTKGFYCFFQSATNVTRDGAECMNLNRLTNDGDLIVFHQAGVSEGSISVTGNTINYNPFLGSHAGALTDWSRPEIKIGTVMDTINELLEYKVVVIDVQEDVPAKDAVLDEEGNEVEPAQEATTQTVQKRISYNGNGAVGSTATVEYEGQEYTGTIQHEREEPLSFNKHLKVKINDTAASKTVFGVFVGWNNDSNNDGGVYNDMLVGAVGNYVIRMAAGQTPQAGDLVEADGNGCAVVQDDDIIRTKTIAKVTSTIPQVTYDDGSFLVTCVLYCG